MWTALHTIVRIFVMAAGWFIALALGQVADMLLTGAKWPIFIGCGSWWTFSCVMWARRDAQALQHAAAARE
jgi:hypothetical protein